jgi:peptidyl-prolyl cis-trans isomerase D
LEDVRDQLKAEVLKQKKAELIMTKIKGKTVQEIATAYGQGAVNNTAMGINLAATSFGDFGYDPIAVGAALGQKLNVMSKPIKGDNGVGVVKMTNFSPAPETKDYSSYKTQIEQKYQGRGQYYINEAMKEVFNIKDNRVKFL